MPIGLAGRGADHGCAVGVGERDDLLIAAPLAGIAILDTTLVVFSRRRRGAAVLSGARDHLTHRLLAALKTPSRVAAALAIGQLGLCALAALLHELDSAEVALISVFYLACGRRHDRRARRPALAARARGRARAGGGGALGLSRIRVLRVIARLNLGGPAHQAALLSGRRMDPERFETLLVHGRLAPGEESMADLAEREGARMLYLPTLGQPISPVADARAFGALRRIDRAASVPTSFTPTPRRPDSSAARRRSSSRPAATDARPHVPRPRARGLLRPGEDPAVSRARAGLARRTDRLIGVSEATVDDLVRLGRRRRERSST